MALWRLGPLYLTEEILTAEAISTVYFLGPNYCANFQSSSFDTYQTYEIINAENIRLLSKLPVHAYIFKTHTQQN